MSGIYNIAREAVSSRFNEVKEVPKDLGLSLASIPLGLFGLGASWAQVVTLGTKKSINTQAELLTSFGFALPKLFNRGIKIINPSAKFDKVSSVSNKVLGPIGNFARAQAAKENGFWNRHIVSRGAFATGAVVSLATCAADLALGCSAAVLSVATLGLSSRVNGIARSNLTFSLVGHNVMYALNHTINPHAQYEEREIPSN